MSELIIRQILDSSWVIFVHNSDHNTVGYEISRQFKVYTGCITKV